MLGTSWIPPGRQSHLELPDYKTDAATKLQSVHSEALAAPLTLWLLETPALPIQHQTKALQCQFQQQTVPVTLLRQCQPRQCLPASPSLPCLPDSHRQCQCQSLPRPLATLPATPPSEAAPVPAQDAEDDSYETPCQSGLTD